MNGTMRKIRKKAFILKIIPRVLINVFHGNVEIIHVDVMNGRPKFVTKPGRIKQGVPIVIINHVLVIILKYYIRNSWMNGIMRRIQKRVFILKNVHHKHIKRFGGCHERSAFVYNRTGSNSGRPYCFSGRVCPHNNLKILHPELMDEWDYEKNSKEGLYPEELSFGSGKYVWWRCQKDPCGCHSWYVSIVDRTREESRHCLYCSNKRVCPHNNLGISYPELMDEWNYGNQYRMILIPLTYYFFDFKFFFLIFPDAMFGILSSWILLSFIFISKSF